MDELTRSLFDDLRHYGEILEDETREDSTGSWRYTTYLYDGVKFFVTMHNGRLVDIG